MSIIIVTGSSGLVGSQCIEHFCSHGFDVIGIDNDMRAHFFGENASTMSTQHVLLEKYTNFTPIELDIRDNAGIRQIFEYYTSDIQLIIHCAAQPSHDWAANDPFIDFSINATGTLYLLEYCRQYSPKAVFIFCSTNKVYGDNPNQLPMIEQDLRWEVQPGHYYENGINEQMSIDQCIHSLFGVSKTASDVLVQEYGVYFGLKTASFRAGCITGPNHRGAFQHGFLSYLAKCIINNYFYNIIGYKGKQVRDNIHCQDLVRAFHFFFNNPRAGEVYNIGGGRDSHCSVLEAIDIMQQISGISLNNSYVEKKRKGDHIWYISDTSKFQKHYPQWQKFYSLEDIISEILNAEECTST